PCFELASVDQAGEDVVARVIRELAIELAAFADVVEHQHAARDGPLVIAYRRSAAFDVQLVAVASDEQRRAYRLDGTGAPDRHRQRVLERLAGFFVEAAEDLVDGSALRVL